MNKRITWIDDLKGFLLLLVCIGHSPINSTLIGTSLAISTAFRMTTFFFLSGVLFSTRKQKTFQSYNKSKRNSLLYPYICLSLLFMFLDPRLYNINFISYDHLLNHSIYDFFQITFPINNSIEYLTINLIKIFIIGHASYGAGPLWFVFVLYLVNLNFYIVHYISKGNNFIILIYTILCLTLGWICSFYSLELPFKLATVFTASFFYSLGYLSKSYLHKLTILKSHTIVLTIIASFVPYIYFINKNGGISLWSNALGPSLPFFILSTLMGIFLIINIFIIYSRNTNKLSIIIKGILRIIARNALIILAVHYWAIRCCNIFLNEYKNTDWYSFLVLTVVISTCILAIPLFRNKLYWLIGKEKISAIESISIK